MNTELNKQKTTFKCPICNKEVVLLNEFALETDRLDQEQTGLVRKKQHLGYHKKIKKITKKIEFKVKQIKDLEEDLMIYNQNLDYFT